MVRCRWKFGYNWEYCIYNNSDSSSLIGWLINWVIDSWLIDWLTILTNNWLTVCRLLWFFFWNLSFQTCRCVIKISSCWVCAISRYGIAHRSFSFSSIFCLFPMNVAGGHAYRSLGKSLAPGIQWKPWHMVNLSTILLNLPGVRSILFWH